MTANKHFKYCLLSTRGVCLVLITLHKNVIMSETWKEEELRLFRKSLLPFLLKLRRCMAA